MYSSDFKFFTKFHNDANHLWYDFDLTGVDLYDASPSSTLMLFIPVLLGQHQVSHRDIFFILLIHDFHVAESSPVLLHIKAEFSMSMMILNLRYQLH